MTLLQTLAGRRHAVAVCAGIALLCWPAQASAEFFSNRDAQRGITMTQQQCAALEHAVWVQVHGHSVCMRYYISTAGGEGSRPVVFLQGDKSWVHNRRTGQWRTPPDDGGTHSKTIVRLTDSFSEAAKTTAIYLARMGTDGSSGDHRDRKTILELQITNVALDAIKRRHRFDGFNLAGQSGGATLVGGLLGLRRDIGCAVPGAGRLSNTPPPPGTPKRKAKAPTRPTAKAPPDPLKRFFTGVEFVPAIVKNAKARILVVTDPQDQTVPYENQTPFVEALRRAGGKVEHYFIEALDPKHHGVTGYSRIAVAACLRGATQTQISAELAKVMAERLTERAKREAETSRKSPSPPAQPDTTHIRTAPKAKLQGA